MLIANLTRTLCKDCGAITLIPGWDWCEKCATDNARMWLTVSDIADTIMAMDQVGLLPADRFMYWKEYGVAHAQVAAAEEEVELRYHALGKRRRRYRGW